MFRLSPLPPSLEISTVHIEGGHQTLLLLWIGAQEIANSSGNLQRTRTREKICNKPTGGGAAHPESYDFFGDYVGAL